MPRSIEWRRLRQPHRHGMAILVGALLALTAACALPPSSLSIPISTPIHTVYVGSEDGHLYAIDTPGGCQRWAFQTRGVTGGPLTSVPADGCVTKSLDATDGSRVHSTPAIGSGIVYFSSDDHYVYAVVASSGKERWEYFLADEATQALAKGYGEIRSSPAVANGTLFIGSLFPDNALYALDAGTGALKWRYQAGGTIRSSPAVDSGIVYFGSDDHYLYALDTATSALLWRFKTGGAVRSSPRVANGVVYVGSDDGCIYALDADSGALKWTYHTGGLIESTPAVADGLVFVGSFDHAVYALDAATGRVVWVYQTGNQVQSSAAVDYGKVFIGSDDHCLYALDEVTGLPRWRYPTGFEVESSPMLVNGVVVVGSDDHNLYALDTTGAALWIYQTGGDVRSSANAE